MAARETSIAEHLERLTPSVRRTVQAARRAVKAAAPAATETGYKSSGPRASTSRSMYKLIRYLVDGEQVAGIGTFADHASLFFRRGEEIDDDSGLLEGSGAARFIRLDSPADAERPAVRRIVRKAVRLP